MKGRFDLTGVLLYLILFQFKGSAKERQTENILIKMVDVEATLIVKVEDLIHLGLVLKAICLIL